MIGNQIGASTRIDPIKIDKLAEFIWEAKVEAYSEMGKTRKQWHTLSVHERNIYKDKAEHFLKFYSKYF